MRGRYVKAIAWVGAAALLWTVLAVVARIPSVQATALTNVLFVLTLSLTYVAGIGAVVSASARPRQAALRASAMTLGVLGTLTLLELAAAARLLHWELIFRQLSGEQQHYVPDPSVGFRHAPNVRVEGRPRSDIEAAWGLPASRLDRVTVTYDQRGYRNAVALPRADVVLIGDSYVEGDYASDDEVMSVFLQAGLHHPVANLGVAGYGPAQELVVLEQDALALQPRVVIWFFFEGNDLYNDHEFENAMIAPSQVRAAAWTGRHGWWHRSLARNAYGYLRLLLHPVVPTYCPHFGLVREGPHRGRKLLFSREASFPWTEFERGQWELTRQTLREGVRLAQAHQVKVLLVYLPLKFRVYRDLVDLPPRSELTTWTLWPLPDLFARFCRAEQLACVDLTEMLRQALREGKMPYAAADSHFSPEGHRLVAQLLQETLASLGWLWPDTRGAAS